MLLHTTTIILGHILYLVYFCPYLTLGLFLSHLCDLLFIFSLIFIVIKHLTSLKLVSLLEYLLLFLDNNVEFSLSLKGESSASVLFNFCLIFCQFQPDVVYKSVTYKKKCVIFFTKCSILDAWQGSEYASNVRIENSYIKTKAYSTVMDKIFGSNSRFHVKQRTTGNV